MGWRPDMNQTQRARLNATRRKMYAKKRQEAGLSYTPKGKAIGALSNVQDSPFLTSLGLVGKVLEKQELELEIEGEKQGD